MNDEFRMTNDELPDGWAETTLEDIARDVTYGYTAKSNRTSGGAKMLRITDIQDNRVNWSQVPFCAISAPDKAKYLLKKWDLVFARTGATVGKSYLIQDDVTDSVFASYLIRVRCLDQEMTRYLSYFFNSPAYWDQITDFSAGIGQPNVNGSKLKGLAITLAPLAEQKRIADKLEAVLGRVDSCRARLDRVPALLKRFRQSVLAAATSGRLTEEWRMTNQNGDSSASEHKTAFELLDAIKSAKLQWAASNTSHNEAARINKRASAFEANPSMKMDGVPDWALAKLEDVVLAVVDCHNKTAPYSPAGIPLVRTSNIRDGRVVWEDMRFVGEATYKFWSKRCPPEPGDIIFTREAPMGEAAIVPDDTKVCLGQRTMLIRPLEALCSSGFLLISLMAPGFRSRSLESAVGTGVKHLRVGDVSDLIITLPPLPEQQEIVRRVEDLFAFADRIEARLAVARKTVERLTPSVLAKAFRGELVSQDPNDEPASTLLERLNKQQVAKPARKTRAKRQ